MPTLQERLNEDMKDAMRQHDQPRLDAIRFLRSAINYAKIDRGHELSDDEVVEVITKQVKQRNESIEMFKKGNRPDLVAKEEGGLAVLMRYMPQQMTEAEIEALVRQVMQETGAKTMADRGKLMGRLMPAVKGKADGALVNRVAVRLLGG